MSAGLYGIGSSNRDLADPSQWGKNIFNATFPAALVCYMCDIGHLPTYLTIDGSGRTSHTPITAESIFGLDHRNPALHFSFESVFEPLRSVVAADYPLYPIDVVLSRQDGGNLRHLRGLEVKLTVVPDAVTAPRSKALQAPEIVVRKPTVEYLALSIVGLFRDREVELLDRLRLACGAINNWSDEAEIVPRLPAIRESVDAALLSGVELQEPVLLQPIWRSEGTSLTLAENAFDVFVWSNWALTRLFIDRTRSGVTRSPISRLERTTVWLAKIMWDFARGAAVSPQTVFDDLTYGTANDKAFAISGSSTIAYLRSPQLETPRITKMSLPEIILGGGERWLSPERRLDAAVAASLELFH